ncbi:MAG: capsular biosynthesis protein [Citrobacter freundii]|nr:capsular biosynthesis protein [Citrobacter freundii]
MSLLKSASTIAGSSVISQLIGALSIWLISHKYDMAEVGLYALNYSIAVVGAQVCTFASQLLIPKQQDDELVQNVVFCLIQSTIIALPYAVLTAWLFHQNILFLYLLTLATAWVLISENLSLRTANFRFLIFQRISVSVVVLLSVLVTHYVQLFYWSWACATMALTISCILHSFDIRSVAARPEVLAMASSNLPIMLINFWFSALTAGYFSVVSRFCLAPVVIIGNAVRNTIFSKWSIDFRNNTFNYQEYTKVRMLLLVLGVICTLGVFIFYPIVMRLGFSEDWINSIETSRYMLPYLFPALAISPLTVIELIFGSHRYFLRIQLEQLAIVLFAFVVTPYFYKDYATSVILFSSLTFIRYAFIYLKMNKRANLLKDKPVII